MLKSHFIMCVMANLVVALGGPQICNRLADLRRKQYQSANWTTNSVQSGLETTRAKAELGIFIWMDYIVLFIIIFLFTMLLGWSRLIFVWNGVCWWAIFGLDRFSPNP